MAEGSVIRFEFERKDRELLEYVAAVSERAATWRKVCVVVDVLLGLLLLVGLLLKGVP
jgi:hypothetical protein